jgi:hypothetical protein
MKIYKIDIEGLENYRYTEDGKIYRIPREENGIKYRKLYLKKQSEDNYPNGRWRLKGGSYTDESIKEFLIETEE